MKKVNRVGEKFITNEGYNVEIVEWFSYINCSIRFDSGIILKEYRYDLIKRRKVKNPFHLSKFNTGFLGIGIYSCTVDKKVSKIYSTWNGMMERCYSENTLIHQPTYRGCSVTKEWHNFQNFASWFDGNYVEGFELDKDILVKDNKVYSSETCRFIPKQLNTLVLTSKKSRGKYPIGVWKQKQSYRTGMNFKGKFIHLGIFPTIEQAFSSYKEAKERYIKEVVEKYKNVIKEDIYNVLMNYSININD